jgi:hypothetical protein
MKKLLQMKAKHIIVIGLMLVIFVGLAVLFHDQLNAFRTLATLRKVDDYPLYVMTYHGDYGFGNFLERGARADARSGSTDQGIADGWACTTFTTLNEEGDAILGRNFDWHNRPSLLLFTDPPDGYASVSMVDISYLGYDAEEPSWADRVALLGAPYLPFDGMNEAGLAIGMMAIPHAEPGKDPRKATISGVEAIRLMLDYARDVDEATALLDDYNIDFSGGPPLHYLIADASGDSAVVEFLDGEMHVVRNDGQWQVSTNFIISEERPERADSSCWRYNKTYVALENAHGSISQEQAMALLRAVSQSGDTTTMWSVVYGMTTGDVQVAMGRNYVEVHDFRLEMLADR